jgi:hypothetical protein
MSSLYQYSVFPISRSFCSLHLSYVKQISREIVLNVLKMFLNETIKILKLKLISLSLMQVHIRKLSTTSTFNAVAQLVEALYYKPEGLGIDSRLYHWNFSLT